MSDPVAPHPTPEDDNITHAQEAQTADPLERLVDKWVRIIKDEAYHTACYMLRRQFREMAEAQRRADAAELKGRAAEWRGSLIHDELMDAAAAIEKGEC